MPKQLNAVRVPDKMADQIQRAAESRGLTQSAWQREAMAAYLDREGQQKSLDNLEARLVATMTRMARDTRNARNDVHMVLAFLDTFVRLYLMHTPPIPKEAVESSAVAAEDRFAKFLDEATKALQGETGMFDRLAQVTADATQDDA